MATIRAKLTVTDNNDLIMPPVTFINPKNNKKVSVVLYPDTGSDITSLDNRFARTLGINVKSGAPQNYSGGAEKPEYYRHRLLLKIGTLKPILTPVDFNAYDLEFEFNTFGVYSMLQYESVVFDPKGDYIIITEKKPSPTPPTTPTTTTKQQAAYAQSFASAFASQVIPADMYDQFHYNIKFFNVKTGVPVLIPMVIDTGGDFTTLSAEWGPKLGITNLKSGIPASTVGIGNVSVNQWMHRIKVQIGILKPITIPVAISEKKTNANLFGWLDVLNRYQLEATKTYLRITEPELIRKEKIAALAISRVGSNFRRRI